MGMLFTILCPAADMRVTPLSIHNLRPEANGERREQGFDEHAANDLDYIHIVVSWTAGDGCSLEIEVSF